MKKQKIFFLALMMSSLLAPHVFAEPTTSPVITVGGSNDYVAESSLSTTTSTPETIYLPGTYTVGTDIPAGEYVLFTQDSDESPCYQIQANNTFVDFDRLSYSCRHLPVHRRIRPILSRRLCIRIINCQIALLW